MGLFKKNPFKNIKRSEVVDSIIELENKRDELFDDLEKANSQIDKLIKSGRTVRGIEEKKVLANKVVALKRNSSSITRRIRFIERKIEVFNEIKNSIDDAHFSNYNKKSKLDKLLKNEKGLQKYLENISINMTLEEESLAKSLDLITNTKDAFTADDSLYGNSSEIDDVLALMECDEPISEISSDSESKIEPMERESDKYDE